MNIKQNYPLKSLTTFGIGGPAKYLAEVKTIKEVREAIRFAKNRSLPFYILGEGSNVLISDEGYDGLVILNRIRGFKNEKMGKNIFVTIGAGENWDSVVKKCVEKNWAGIECLSGIPGAIGAGPVQNIGAYGQTISDTLVEVNAVDVKKNKIVTLDREECKFRYRKSIFNTEEAGRYIITSVKLKLLPNTSPTIVYHDLKNKFVSHKKPSLADVRKAVLGIRASKGMVIMPEYESFKSAGSFFKNPILSADAFEKIKNKISSNCKTPWNWELPKKKVKISAACLIQASGFAPGYRLGNVGISPKHTLALINCGNGTAREIIILVQLIQEKIKTKFNLILQPEVQFLGLDTNPLFR